MGSRRKERGRPPIEGLTNSQRSALKELAAFIASRTFPPTMKELGAALGISAASAHQQILQLERKGFVSRQPRQARSLRVLHIPSRTVEKLISIPILGVVRAGPAMLAEENVLGEVLIEGRIAERGRCFALRIKGDSMIGADMRQGDLAIIRQQSVAESGDIVVALIEGDATVKRLFIQGDRIELRAENKRYKPIVIGPECDFQILGKVIAVKKTREGSTKE